MKWTAVIELDGEHFSVDGPSINALAHGFGIDENEEFTRDQSKMELYVTPAAIKCLIPKED